MTKEEKREYDRKRYQAQKLDFKDRAYFRYHGMKFRNRKRTLGLPEMKLVNFKGIE